jgi:hypothetical protein
MIACWAVGAVRVLAWLALLVGAIWIGVLIGALASTRTPGAYVGSVLLGAAIIACGSVLVWALLLIGATVAARRL